MIKSTFRYTEKNSPYFFISNDTYNRFNKSKIKLNDLIDLIFILSEPYRIINNSSYFTDKDALLKTALICIEDSFPTLTVNKIISVSKDSSTPIPKFTNPTLTNSKPSQFEFHISGTGPSCFISLSAVAYKTSWSIVNMDNTQVIEVFNFIRNIKTKEYNAFVNINT